MAHCTTHQRCITTAFRQAEAICNYQHARLTPLRRTVLELIWQSHKPAKAYDLLHTLQKKDKSAKPPTIYRALEFLHGLGLVHKLSSANAFVGCSHPGEAHACYFLLCRKCGEARECCSDPLTRAIAGVARSHRFKPAATILEIEGVCEHCH